MPGGYCPLPLQLRSGPDGISAAAWNRMASDLAHASRTAPFAVMRLHWNGAARILPDYVGRNGVGWDADVSIDAVTTPTRINNSKWTFPRTWTDDSGRVHPFRISRVKVTPIASDHLVIAEDIGTWMVDGVSIEVRTWIRSGSNMVVSVQEDVIVQVWADESTSWHVYGGLETKCDSTGLPPAAAYYEVIRDRLGTAYNCQPGTLVDAEVCAEARAVAAFHREADRIPLDAMPGTATGNLEQWAKLLQVDRTGRDDDEVRALCATRYAGLGLAFVNLAAVEAAAAEAMGSFYLSVEVDTSSGLNHVSDYTAIGRGYSDYIRDQFDLGGGCWTSGRSNIIIRCRVPGSSEREDYLRRAHTEVPRVLRRLIPATATWSVAAGEWVLDSSALDIDTTLS